MDASKLNEIVNEENARLEREAVDRAKQLIREIGRLKQSIQESEGRIGELQGELRKLQVTALDAGQILGN